MGAAGHAGSCSLRAAIPVRGACTEALLIGPEVPVAAWPGARRRGLRPGAAMADVTARSLQYEYKAVSAAPRPPRPLKPCPGPGSPRQSGLCEASRCNGALPGRGAGFKGKNPH